MTGRGKVLVAGIAAVAAVGLYLAGYARVIPLPDWMTGKTDRTTTALYQSRLDYFRQFPAVGALVFVGDSLTEFGEWAEHFPEYRVANRGIGNDHTIGLAQRLGALGDLSQSTVILTIGVNDVLALRSQPSDIIARYQAIVGELMSRSKAVVLQSTIPVTAPADTRANVSFAEMNVAMQASCRDNCSYLDLAALRAEDGSLRSDMTIDGIHLNGAGYLAWAKALREHLAGLEGEAGPQD
ncbi:MAG: hypothetical protein JNK47_07980 [Mesorhizobium sp.]|nr:GDSL-type esterase/lipase family protein [Mesorhizobium sp.]MBL8577149.1 hypothetical protein [Mesorhizobium sp.]